MMCLAKMVCFFVHLAITHGCHCNSIDVVGDVFMGCSQKGLFHATLTNSLVL